jgi:hypothetical protein
MLTALITGLGLYLGPKFAVRRAIEQFREQTWWGKQQEAYTQVLENLAVIKHCMAAQLNHLKHPDFMLAPHVQFLQQTPQAGVKLQHLAALGPYYLSETASEALDKFVAEWGIETGLGEAEECERKLQGSIAALSIIRREANDNLKTWTR